MNYSINKFDKLNIEYNKAYELILSILSVYLLNHEELRNNSLDWVETPNIKYMEELKKIITKGNYEELAEIVLSFSDEGSSLNIAIALDNKYNLVEEKMDRNFIEKYVGIDLLSNFINKLKEFAYEINWDSFYEKHEKLYNAYMYSFSVFPDNLNLNDIDEFYNYKLKSTTYLPSILMNGGFSAKDDMGNLYYNRGFKYDIEKSGFIINEPYVCECLFHEFSHSYINPLVDKYIDELTNIDYIYNEGVENNLPKSYQENKRIIIYEYLVRANANILNRKYYKDELISEGIINHGFKYLNELVNYISENKSRYTSYEEFYKNDLIYYINENLHKEYIKK